MAIIDIKYCSSTILTAINGIFNVAVSLNVADGPVVYVQETPYWQVQGPKMAERLLWGQLAFF